MYGWGRGFSAGLSPAARTDNPVYQYLGRFGSDTLVRDGDSADKLGLPIGHEFTAIGDDPIPDAPLVLLGQPVVKQPLPVYSPPPVPAVVPVVVPAAGGLLDSIPWWAWLGAAGAGLYAWKGKR